MWFYLLLTILYVFIGFIFRQAMLDSKKEGYLNLPNEHIYVRAAYWPLLVVYAIFYALAYTLACLRVDAKIGFRDVFNRLRTPPHQKPSRNRLKLVKSEEEED